MIIGKGKYGSPCITTTRHRVT